MSVGITLAINSTPYTTLKTQIKEADKDVKQLLKDIDQAKKEGKAVSEETYAALQKAEKRSSDLRQTFKDHGAKMRYQEQFNAQHRKNVEEFNIKGLLKDKLEMSLDKFANREGVKSILESKALNRATGGAGKALLEGGLGKGMAALGETAAAYGSAAGILTALPAGILAGESLFNHYSEAAQNAERDFRLKMSDRNFTDHLARSLDQRRHQEEMSKESALGQLGLSFWSNRNRGIDAYSRFNDELRQANAQFGGGEDQLRALAKVAKSRVYADEWGSRVGGFIMENTYGRLKEFFGSNADAKATIDKVKEMNAKFDQYLNAGNTRAIEGDFDGAREAYKLADEVKPGQGAAWRDPIRIWTANQEATKAEKAWAITQNPLPALRIGQ